jgi:hypothetical protein
VVRNSRVFAAGVVLVANVLAVSAQDRQLPATPSQEQAPEETGLRRLVKHPPELDQGGGLHFTKHFAVVFGGIKPGSSVAAGPAVSTTFADGGYAQVKGVYSLRQFKLLQGRYDTRAFWAHRVRLITRIRWQDAPDLALYELGPDSSPSRAKYGEQKSEIRTELEARLTHRFRVGAGIGTERYTLSGGSIDVGEEHPLTTIPGEPGLSAHPWFTHAFASAAYDTRPHAYSRSGRVIDGIVDDYRDWNGGTYAFQRAEAGVEQLVRVRSDDAVDLAARMWASVAGEGHFVPFFLMPTLGGGDYLDAFNVYRFRDLDAAWFKVEYRHAVHEMVDAIGFYELGTVAGSPKALSFANGIASVGIGVLTHTPTAPVTRITLAHGRDGFHFSFVFIAFVG